MKAAVIRFRQAYSVTSRLAAQVADDMASSRPNAARFMEIVRLFMVISHDARA
jgi:hypothetical protein